MCPSSKLANLHLYSHNLVRCLHIVLNCKWKIWWCMGHRVPPVFSQWMADMTASLHRTIVRLHRVKIRNTEFSLFVVHLIYSTSNQKIHSTWDFPKPRTAFSYKSVKPSKQPVWLMLGGLSWDCARRLLLFMVINTPTWENFRGCNKCQVVGVSRRSRNIWDLEEH